MAQKAPGRYSLAHTLKRSFLDPKTLDLARQLHGTLGAERIALLEARRVPLPWSDRLSVEFPEATAALRVKEWQVASPPESLLERRVELLGGATRQELVDGLNTGAKSYVADLWDLCAGDPWRIIRSHRNLERASKADLAYVPAEGGRIRMNPASTVRLMVVPRPLHVPAHAAEGAGEDIAASIIDLARLVGNCANNLMERQGGVFLYLRDLRSQQEAGWWGRLFHELEESADLPTGTIRATVMIDNVRAVLEADEILFALAQHSAGLSFDPQACVADIIAQFHDPQGAPLPGRETIGLDSPFLRALSLHLIGLCHRRGCHAIGPPSFTLPPKDPLRAGADHLTMLADKERQAVDGHDGTLVTHAGQVNAAVMEFNKGMPRAHQMNYLRHEVFHAADLLRTPEGPVAVDSLLAMTRTALCALTYHPTGQGRVEQGGRLHDRSSLRLALRMLWHWLHLDKPVSTSSGLEIRAEVIGYLLRKEAGKLFAQEPEEIKELARAAADQLLALVTADAVPDEPL